MSLFSVILKGVSLVVLAPIGKDKPDLKTYHFIATPK